jgi:SAM-dependent methyltransferase
MGWNEVIEAAAGRDRILGLPFVAERPDAYKAALAYDAYEFLFAIKALIKDLADQAASPGLLELTRRRLEHLRAANEQHLAIMEPLLRPLGHGNLPLTDVSQQLVKKRPTPVLTRHYELLCRDWSWGVAEVDAAMDITRRVVGAPPPGVTTALALGAGACRYPYEIHRWLGLDYTLCVDISPLLLACAKRVIEGEPLALMEFPIIPRDLASFALKSELQCPAPLARGLEFLVHDLDEWAFRDKSFDLVITSWLIDVIPIPPPRLFSLINRVLKDGGHWLNLGPLGFNKRMLARYYSLEEVVELVGAARFELLSTDYSVVPYLQHPASGHGRTEGVLTFLARKTADAPIVDRSQGSELPDWVADTARPVRVAFDASEIKKGYEFSAHLLGKLGSSSSIDSLARDVSASFGMPQTQAKYLVTGMLLRLHDAARKNPMK